MAYFKHNEDGTIQSASTKLDASWQPLSLLQRDEEGKFYTFYHEDGSADKEKEKKAKEGLFRIQRDVRLKEADSYQLVLRYEALSKEQKEQLIAYRKALLDATTQWVLPTRPTWFN